MFCTNCGKEIPDGSEFCPNCGNQIGNSSEKTVKVIWHRKKGFLGCAVSIKVFVDGKVVATLKNNGTSEVDIPCGKHKVTFDYWGGADGNEVIFSDEYSKIYIEVGLKMGLITNKIKILSIKNEK